MASSLRLALLSLFILFFSFQSVSSLSKLPHPLDPLREEEITLVQTIVLKKYPNSTHAISFQYVGLDDPDKPTVLKWEIKPNIVVIPRRAFVIAIVDTVTHELLIDLKLHQIHSDNIHTGNGFPTLTIDEQSDAIELPLKYTPFIESVEKRGLNISEVVCSVFTIGWYGEEKSKRGVRLECFLKQESANIYVRPISGIIILVDLDQMEIVYYHDVSKETIPTETNTEYRASHMKPPFAPKQYSYGTFQPEGPGFKLNGHSLSWANWKMHIGYDVRAGVTVSLASIYDLDMHKSRKVLYRGYISELFVPYQDPSEEWYYKTFFDAGEFGFGQSMVSLEPLQDCPPNAQFVDAYYAGRDGSPQHLANAFCVFEQYGNILWRHTETGIPNEEE